MCTALIISELSNPRALIHFKDSFFHGHLFASSDAIVSSVLLGINRCIFSRKNLAMPLIGFDVSVNVCWYIDSYAVAGLMYDRVYEPSADAAAAAAEL